MERYYFITDDLDELAAAEAEFETRGVDRFQIHVLSQDDREIALRHLHEVHPFMKTDVIRSGLLGACFGVAAAGIVMGFAHFGGLATAFSWVPFVFLAIVLLGFCTWEGGFFGFQVPNKKFRRFQDALRDGKHILLVDLKPEQIPILEQVSGHHGKLAPAGKGVASPAWILAWQQHYKKFVESAP